eukprot:scpid109141/ scgid5158/ 
MTCVCACANKSEEVKMSFVCCVCLYGTDLQETVKKFTDAVSDKRRVMYEIWALVFNVLHLLQSIGAERVRWSPPGYTDTCSYTLGVTMILVLCECGEHLGD